MVFDTQLYDLLGVTSDAGEGDIKKAYRKKARENHPDKNPNDPSAGQRFQEIAAAYEILIDPNARETYDMHGMEGLTGPGGGGSEMDAADLFEFFSGGGFHFGFGPGFGGGQRRRNKGQDSVIPYEVTLEDLYNGKSVKMNMEKEVLCGVCKGTGAKGNAKPKECVKCEGKGWTVTTTALGSSRLGTSRIVCPDCEGGGTRLKEKDRCKKCKGNKTISEKKRQEIFVEKGMTDGQRIVLAGEGDQTPNTPAGDVIFVLKQQKHASFERSSSDLLTTVKITLSEALLGFNRILVTHLDGRGLQVSSLPGKVVNPNDTIVLRGEGMPVYKQPDQKGDLYIVFEVEFPSNNWMQTVDRNALEALLPPKKPELVPRPAIVDEAAYEESDLVDFGEGGADAWVDEDDEDDIDGMSEPDCRQQ